MTVVGEFAQGQKPPNALYFVDAQDAEFPSDSAQYVATCAKPGSTAETMFASMFDSAQAFPVMCADDITNTVTQTPVSATKPFVWTFALNAPPGADEHQYNAVAIFAGQGSAQNNAPQVEKSSSGVFTVLSASGPCVVAVSTESSATSGIQQIGASGTCTPQTPVFLTPGKPATVHIEGANWLPSDKFTVEVVASCATGSGQACTKKSFELDPNQNLMDNGSFSGQATIPANIAGVYVIQARSVVSGTPKDPASGAVTFSSTAPTLVVENPSVDIDGAGVSCSPSVCTVQSGGVVSISGHYWSTPPVVYVEFASTPCKARETSLPAGLGKPDAIGTFQTDLPLAELKDGTTYKICANGVTAAHELTIGSPDTSGSAQTVAWLALLLGVASLGLYIFRPRRQGFVH